MFARFSSRRDGEIETAQLAASRSRLAELEAELAAALTLRQGGDVARRIVVEWYARAVEQSVSLSELLCLMAWSNGNVRKLSGETVAISGAVEEMARTIENIAALSAAAQERASDAHRIVGAGVGKSTEAGRAMEEIAQAFSGLDRRMQMLGGAIESIGGFAKEIESISSQTKLLALNATIEAARAGEAGRGFAVVAAEVKALSEETSRTTELIRGQLATLADVMRDMLSAMDLGGSKVRDGNRMFSEVVGDMEGIRDCVQGVKGEVASITHMLKDQQIATDSISRNLTEIARLAGQNETDSNAAADSIRKAQAAVETQLGQGAGAGVADYDVRRLRADHMLWKQQLAECLVGIVKLDPSRYAADVAPLGKGFRQVGNAAVTASPPWRELQQLADSMARDGVKVVQAASHGDIGKAIEAYMAMDGASGTAMAKAAELERLIERG